MNRMFLPVLFLLLVTSCGDKSTKSGDKNNGQEDPNFAVDVGTSVIPYIVIDTEDDVPNEPKVAASMEIYVQKELVKTQQIGIEYRGSTSFRISDKKSFGIETWDNEGNDVDATFFGMPKEEDWVLNGHVVNTNVSNPYIWDVSLMRHFLAYELFRNMGNYASRTQFSELELNGEYLGVYVFMEKLKRDADRIDISSLNAGDTDISGGYILKIDKTTGGEANAGKPLSYFLNNWDDDAIYTEQNSFRSRYNTTGVELVMQPYGTKRGSETYFQYEYPKSEDITDDQKEYISSYLDNFETALLNDDLGTEMRTYTEYIDLDSFVDMFIINELSRNIDGYRLSTYLYKDKGGKLNIGPPWDFNIGFDFADERIPWDSWVINYNNYSPQDTWLIPFWWSRLLEDQVFKSAVKARWDVLRLGALSNSSIESIIDSNANYLKDNGGIDRNYKRWDTAGVGANYDASIASLKTFLDFRLDWMDAEIANF